MRRIIRASKVFILALILIIIMSGCVRVEFGIEINEDGTGRVTNLSAITKEFYDYLVENNSDPFPDQEIETRDIDGETYVCFTEDYGKLTYKEIEDKLAGYVPDLEDENAKTFFKEASIKKKKGLFKTEYRLKLVTNKDAVEGAEGMPANEIFEMYTYVKMPGKVTSHETKNNRVEILFDDFDEEKTYEIVSTKTNTSLIIILVALLFVFMLVIVGVVVVIIVVVKKRKAKNMVQE